MREESQAFDWEELLICISDRRVIPVIGKELLVVGIDGEEMLLETFLASHLVERLKLPREKIAPDAGLNDVAMLHFDQGGERRKIYSHVKAIMQEHAFESPETLRKLASITDFKLFVSLTFDSLLQEAIDTARFSGDKTTIPLVYSPNREIEDIPDKVENLLSPYVFQIFGQASSTTDYAVTDEDVLEFTYALQTENRPQLLFDELRNHHLLFLGCGFQNWLERFMMRTISNNRMLTRETYGFVADEGVRRDENLTVFLKHYRTEVFLSGLATEFVDSLFDRWCERNPAIASGEIPPGGGAGDTEAGVGQSETRRMKPGAIFVSYASEDRAAAQNIKAALDKEGLEVWFDKKGLNPGMEWDQEIRRNIQRCSFFLPLISTTAQSRLEGYFRKEWKWAIDRAEGMAATLKFILPVIIDEIPDQAAGIPEQFWARQGVRLRDGKPTSEFISHLKQAFRERQLREAGLR